MHFQRKLLPRGKTNGCLPPVWSKIHDARVFLVRTRQSGVQRKHVVKPKSEFGGCASDGGDVGPRWLKVAESLAENAVISRLV
jgi:hypothetical protein